MKKLLSIFALIFVLFSCENEVRTNTPAFQAQKDNVFWRAVDSKVTLYADGSMAINAYSDFEVVTLRVPSTTPNTYILGNSANTYATYTYSKNGVTKHYDTENGDGNGEIIIKAGNEPGTYTGTFKFNAEDEEGNVLNYNQGIFYKVPVY